ncbi:hypothetical protein RHRU231_430184 [Rhodococcus ruber]|uniref:Uncharacterized protein n=1 Tax=Rhodococcus ruber TaxID=1830 RepID=A0A098BM60_9NOCA|nr:hypothetical protein RHRU231_430184 [Rhodococcus ruber]
MSSSRPPCHSPAGRCPRRVARPREQDPQRNFGHRSIDGRSITCSKERMFDVYHVAPTKSAQRAENVEQMFDNRAAES